MGIVYNVKSGGGGGGSRGYKKKETGLPTISHRRTVKTLTRRNIQYLKSLGLKVKVGGR